MPSYTRREIISIASALSSSLLIKPLNAAANALSQNIRPDVDLIRKGDTLYDELRRGYNLRINLFPEVIARCTSSAEVVTAIRYAIANKLAVAIKSGGHSMEGFSCNNDGLVVDVSNLDSIALQSNVVTVGPGCRLGSLSNHLLAKGRLVPAGSCATVGLGGLILGGGYGFFSRKYGLTCDHLLEATIVDGTGNIRSTRDDQELLWALRGGGAGNFGVVTELVIDSVPAPALFQSHHFKARNLNVERATSILENWFALVSQLPADCFSAYVLNGHTINILVTNFEPVSSGTERVLNGLSNITDSYIADEPSGDIGRALKRYSGSLTPLYFKNASAGFYRNFEDIKVCVREILGRVMETRGMIYQVNTLGGNISDRHFELASSYPHRAFNFLSELQSYWHQPQQAERLISSSQEIQRILESNGIASQYINYCSLDFKNWQTAYYGKNYSRLQAIKKRYDPNNLFQYAQGIQLPS